MQQIMWNDAEITGGFWKEKEELNRKITINAVYDRFYETGRIDAFKCNWRDGMKNKPHIFWDSDVVKWMEGAAYILYRHKDAELESKVENIIDMIEENMGRDGYFNIYFTAIEPAMRFKQRFSHELYCAGHMIEAGVAYYYATGKERFLNLCRRYADYIYEVFIVRDEAAFRTCGHEEIELALYRLYKCTNEKKYLELMKFFIFQRGNNDKDEKNTDMQDYAPVTEQKEATGHCVRAMYLYCAMADLAKETGDESLKESVKILFDDVYTKKMYITGGLGSTYKGESFTKPYDLPPETSYAETCAAIGFMLFSNRMLSLENNSKYADAVERAMYNGMLAGLSVSGDAFFYENPLEINLSKRNRYYDKTKNDRYSITERVKVFDCSCCPPNLNRILSSMENYIYGMEDGCVFVNQYMQSEAQFENIKINQETNYPNDGEIRLKIDGAEKVALRIPGWCEKFSLNCDYEMKDGYAVCDCGGEIVLKLEIKPFLVMANSLCYDVSNKTALQAGPVVYCAEKTDNDCENMHMLYVAKELEYTSEYDEELSCEVFVLKGYKRKKSDKLYQKLNNDFEDTKIKFIPYRCFANRGESDMTVFMNHR